MDELRAAKVDAAFELRGVSIPRDHRGVLAQALARVLPWLADPAQASLHRINAVAGGGATALLSQRARLALRVRRERLGELAALDGVELDLQGHALQLHGPAVVRELLPWGTLYAHLVSTGDDDELAFLDSVAAELKSLHVACRPVCGRRQVFDDDGREAAGFSLMLDGLAPEDSLRVLESGLGRHRQLGCGLFVPHKSAAALRA